MRETLVLLPGMMCDARLFGPQIAALQDSTDIIVGDLTGRDTIAGLADSVLGSVPDRFNLAGLSMGGIVAMAIAGMASARVQRLALLDTNFHADAPERSAVRERQIEGVRDGRLREVVVDELKPNYLAAENQDDQALRDLLVDMALGLGADAFVSQSLAVRDRPDQTAVLSSWKGPALVLSGEEDTLCPPAWHREMAGLLQDAELVIVPGAGHISTLERPDAVTAALQRWLARRTL